MTGFVFFSIHLAVFIFALHSLFMGIYRRDIEKAGAMLVVVLIQIVSLANGYYDWYWHLSGLLGISWPGN
jgi:hypothetical protein